MMSQKVSLVSLRPSVLPLALFRDDQERLPACAAIVGDITPKCGVSKQEKAELEARAITDIQHMLGADTAVGEVSHLYNKE